MRLRRNRAKSHYLEKYGPVGAQHLGQAQALELYALLPQSRRKVSEKAFFDVIYTWVGIWLDRSQVPPLRGELPAGGGDQPTDPSQELDQHKKKIKALAVAADAYAKALSQMDDDCWMRMETTSIDDTFRPMDLDSDQRRSFASTAAIIASHAGRASHAFAAPGRYRHGPATSRQMERRQALGELVVIWRSTGGNKFGRPFWEFAAKALNAVLGQIPAEDSLAIDIKKIVARYNRDKNSFFINWLEDVLVTG